MYYASFGLLAIVLHVIINIESLRRPRDGAKTKTNSLYRNFLYGAMLYYVTDILWGGLYELKNVPLVYTDTVLYFFSMGLSLIFWTRFCIAYLNKKNVFSTILKAGAWSIFTFEIVLLIINIFIPIMFSFDKSGEYLPGQSRYLILDVQIAFFVIMAIYTLIQTFKMSGRDRNHHLAIGISGLIMAAFIFLQAKFPLAPFYAIGLLIATSVMHTFVEVDERLVQTQKLGSVKKIAYKDALTSVRNVNAYAESKCKYNHGIRNGSITEIGVVVFDVNDLKFVNDTYGHEAGDKYIQDSCKLICNIFKHSPVFRIGGDEFVAVLLGEDYGVRDEIFSRFNAEIERNRREGGPIVSAGISIYDPSIDTDFESVFARADQKMYERKKYLKAS